MALVILAGATGAGVGLADEGPLPMLPGLGSVSAVPAAEPAPPAAAPAAEPEADQAEAAQPEAAQPEAGPPAAPDELVRGTPCTATARACVDVVGKKAWLLANGRIVRGPVRNMTGDREDPTPRGTFQVEWKAEQWTSREYFVEMPYSVFFAPGGIAFHQGNQQTASAGCVKLTKDDAIAFFEFLQIGDEVQVR